LRSLRFLLTALLKIPLLPKVCWIWLEEVGSKRASLSGRSRWSVAIHDARSVGVGDAVVVPSRHVGQRGEAAVGIARFVGRGERVKCDLALVDLRAGRVVDFSGLGARGRIVVLGGLHDRGGGLDDGRGCSYAAAVNRYDLLRHVDAETVHAAAESQGNYPSHYEHDSSQNSNDQWNGKLGLVWV